MSEELELEVVQLGEKVINEKDITPSDYFDYVKGLKQKVNKEEMYIIIDTALKMLQKTKITKQLNMAKELTHQVELTLRELNVANQGFDIFVNRKDVERYLKKVDRNVIKTIELSRYPREIPDDKMDIIAKASDLFDRLYIIFTDYTGKEEKKVAKERRDKDPIVFGTFVDKNEKSSNNKVYVEDRFYFITDWVEEKCDLTLEEIVRDVKDKTSKDITYKITTPTDEEEVKKYMRSFSEPIENHEPTSIFDTIKRKVTKRRGRPKKSVKKEE